MEDATVRSDIVLFLLLLLDSVLLRERADMLVLGFPVLLLTFLVAVGHARATRTVKELCRNGLASRI